MAPLDISEARGARFDDKVVIVTGGSSGIGYAIVKAFAERGARVAISDLNPPPAVPAGSTFIQADVTNWGSQINLFKETVAKFGRLDVVCANAGISESKTQPFEDKVDEYGEPLEPDWSTISVNVIGALNTIKLAIHYLKAGGGGSIVVSSSLSGYDAYGLPTYATSKHAMVGTLRGLRAFTPQLNININVLAPGFTKTNILPPQGIKDLEEAGVKIQEPEAVALAAIYFASRPDVNGQGLSIVGGKYNELEDDLKQAFLNATAGSSSNSERARQGGNVFKAVEKLFGVVL